MGAGGGRLWASDLEVVIGGAGACAAPENHEEKRIRCFFLSCISASNHNKVESLKKERASPLHARLVQVAVAVQEPLLLLRLLLLVPFTSTKKILTLSLSHLTLLMKFII